jgi:hypothetical protein
MSIAETDPQDLSNENLLLAAAAAFVDVLDGVKPSDIQGNTGLDLEQCKRIRALMLEVTRRRYELRVPLEY